MLNITNLCIVQKVALLYGVNFAHRSILRTHVMQTTLK